MAALKPFQLLFCVLLFVSRCQASNVPQLTTTSNSNVTSNNETHNATTHPPGGHGGSITTLPIVSWKWHHIEAPYIVALWVLVCWLCKLGKSWCGWAQGLVPLFSTNLLPGQSPINHRVNA